ncbi:hypothetical protein EVAR_103507_1 [Eumeta japonica]|uniref:Uncharacterized protein n=1 Tax=Eumeta variegata TaxID=151549 RepID=A0A4C1YVZ1_EUMVA|nr:hypothetical protein EVAR_103507_1 [Eumeta japonica]
MYQSAGCARSLDPKESVQIVRYINRFTDRLTLLDTQRQASRGPGSPALQECFYLFSILSFVDVSDGY